MDHRELIRWLREARARRLSDMEIQRHLHDAGLTHGQINVLLVSGYVPIGDRESMLDTVKIERAATLPPALVIFGESWTLFRRRARALAGITLICVAGIALLYASAAFLTNRIPGEADSAGLNALTFTPGAAGAVLSLLIAAAGGSSIILAWMVSAIMITISAPSASFTAVRAIIDARKYVMRVWWASLVAAWISIGGLALGIIPGVIFGVQLSFVALVAVTEGARGLNAAGASRRHCRNSTLALLYKYALLLVPLGAAMGLAGFHAVSICRNLNQENALAHSCLSMLTLCGTACAVGMLSLPGILCYAAVLRRYLKNQSSAQAENPPRDTGNKKMLWTAGTGWLLLPVIFMVIIGIGTQKIDLEQARERNIRRTADIDSLHNALMLYHTDNGSYPATLDELGQGYLATYPRDPATNREYRYTISDSGGFKLCAVLEKEEQSVPTDYCRD